MPNTPFPTFVAPHPVQHCYHFVSKHISSQRLPHQCYVFRGFSAGRPIVVNRSRLVRTKQPVAVQTRQVSGDSDGETRENVTVTTQKSFSVGLTIVSGFEAHLRRSVIERIVSDADAGRVVVVTTGGITSTDETDGPVTSHAPIDDVAEDRESTEGNGLPVPENGSNHETSVPSSSFSISSVHNLEGWISCSSSEEMVEVVVKLATSRECDYIIAECAVDTNMEPQDLARSLHSRSGASLRVDTLVSVLDGETLLKDLLASPQSDAMPDTEDVLPVDEAPCSSSPSIHDSAQQRPMILVNLVEHANVVVVAQNNHEQSEQLSRVQNVVSLLNGSASVVPALEGEVQVDRLINTNSYDKTDVESNATVKKVLHASRSAQMMSKKGGSGKSSSSQGGTKPNLPKSLKEATFLYSAKRPFHPGRLYEHIKDVTTFAGVIRSTGRIWLATRMRAPLEWNQAGVAATLCLGKLFWDATPESDWPTAEEERDRIMANWDTRYGDRETEIVFVGIDIDKSRLQGLLDGCLLQDEEMVFTNLWENFEDPFVEWVPLREDDEEAMEEEVEVTSAIETEEKLSEKLVEQNVADHDYEGNETDIETPSGINGTEENVIKSSDNENIDADASQSLDKVQGSKELVGDESLKKKALEGLVDDEDLPDEVYDEITALDIFEEGFPEGESDLVSQPEDDGHYDKDDAVIASWDGNVADGILTKIPKTGLPVTLVTGFLGSGKTTLLNYILTADHKLRIAVLVNEFGEIDIDNQLVQKGDWSSEEVVELSNGCICCDINDSFIEAVNKVLKRREDVDYLIVETTGVADPAPVVNSLMMTDIAEQVRLDGVLTLVDAENFDVSNNMQSEAALRQIMAADTILLSKTDVASRGQVEKVIQFIQEFRPAARILKSQRGRVPIDLILDVGLRVADSPSHLDPAKESKTAQDLDHDHNHHNVHRVTSEHGHNHGTDNRQDDNHDGHHAHDHDHDHECGPDCTHESHSHNHLEIDGFVTTSFKSDLPLDIRLFVDKFLRTLPEGVYRAKGLLYFYGFPERYIFQLSGRRYHLEFDDWPEGEAPGNQLVIIGRGLDLIALRETLESCHAIDTNA